jgi:hypothetical protein
LADLLLGLSAISFSVGRIGFLLYFDSFAGITVCPVKSSIVHERYGVMRFFTILSSIE